MSDEGPLVLQLAPNRENISKIERTTSLALIMNKYHSNHEDYVKIKIKTIKIGTILIYVKD